MFVSEDTLLVKSADTNHTKDIVVLEELQRIYEITIYIKKKIYLSKYMALIKTNVAILSVLLEESFNSWKYLSLNPDNLAVFAVQNTK